MNPTGLGKEKRELRVNEGDLLGEPWSNLKKKCLVVLAMGMRKANINEVLS